MTLNRDSLLRQRTRQIDEDGMRAARAVAGWYLGSPSWADKLIGAYLYPVEALENLRDEKGEMATKPEDS